MSTKTTIEALEARLDEILFKADEDGIYGDGSHERYAAIFEAAYDRADSIAREAIRLLKERQ